MSEPLVDQLLALCVAAESDPDFKARSEDLGMPSFGALIEFAREHKHPLVQEVLMAVNTDAEVLSVWEPDNGLCLATGTGTSERPDEVWLENFLFRVLTNPKELWPTLAEDFLTAVNGARAEWRRRLLSWNRWLLILLGAGFVLFSLVFTILLLVMAR
jgi:hypothetical protein